MGRELQVGQAVVFIDELRERHVALTTHVWQSLGGLPGCNVVYVVDDASKTDPYGRQIERRTSIVHHSVQPAGGMCWAWPDEDLDES
jgi:hypothetical protein